MVMPDAARAVPRRTQATSKADERARTALRVYRPRPVLNRLCDSSRVWFDYVRARMSPLCVKFIEEGL